MSCYNKILSSQTVFITIIFSFLFILLFACEKFEPKRIVRVTTGSITNVDYTSCTVQGSILDIGENGITQHGFCWSTSQDPTLADSKKELGPKSSTGNFSDILTELSPNSTYYIKAFAQSHDEEFYGDQKSFVTRALTVPTVITTSVSSITQNSAQSGGNITDNGGAEVIARGVCWSTFPNPTTADNHTDDGSGTGIFISNLTVLNTGTTYYVRAYATNSAGSGYGQEESFETDWGQSGTFTDNRNGGHEYEWIRLGDQIWMAENLAYLPSVGPPSDRSYTEPYYYVYGYEGTNVSEAKATDNYNIYGVLYNWTAASNACPDGWHLPSDGEWKELEMFLGMSQADADANGWRGTGVGDKLKAVNGWIYDGNGTNESGFTALPGGFRIPNFDYGDFSNIGGSTAWWSYDEEDIEDSAWGRSVSSVTDDVLRTYHWKEYGYSVRCLKDD